MAHDLIACRLLELGHNKRLAIFRLLVKNKEMCVGDIQRTLKIPASTLSHHLARLVSVGLIMQTRKRCSIFCRANLPALNEVICYLQSECCLANQSKPVQNDK